MLIRASGGELCGSCHKRFTYDVYNPQVTHVGGEEADHPRFHYNCIEKRIQEQMGEGSSLSCPIDDQTIRFVPLNSLLSRRERLLRAMTTAAYTGFLGLTTTFLGWMSARTVTAVSASGEFSLASVLAFAQLGTGLELIGAEVEAGPGYATGMSTFFYSIAASTSAQWIGRKAAAFFAPSLTALAVGGVIGILVTQMLVRRVVPLDDRKHICNGIFSGMGLALVAETIPTLLKLKNIELPNLTAAVALPAIALFGSAVAFLKSM